jgi:hypothetical protein
MKQSDLAAVTDEAVRLGDAVAEFVETVDVKANDDGAAARRAARATVRALRAARFHLTSWPVLRGESVHVVD